jgi:hypothetical protein
MKNLQDAGINNVFFWINPVEKCTRSFQQRKNDVMTSFWHSARSAVYCKACRFPICRLTNQHEWNLSGGWPMRYLWQPEVQELIVYNDSKVWLPEIVIPTPNHPIWTRACILTNHISVGLLEVNTARQVCWCRWSWPFFDVVPMRIYGGTSWPQFQKQLDKRRKMATLWDVMTVTSWLTNSPLKQVDLTFHDYNASFVR